ncbi:Acyl-CoA N-acyltransferase [Akanthomyces lecanii RCEF 1005]|uniref:Acyl-CoA N-acyltransferase n=1 Tax=Akanthomyces lecanii RCEF 1005 TaxID=1081108 RepID=A0A162KLJ4_CORDF|nr:Acyl-CoA N-acyltransferase [Akanthomyces lecanii RCEF 1005]
MPQIGKFHIRDAGTSPIDLDAIMGSLDASVHHLASNGNGEQWGPKLFSERDGYREDVGEDLKTSENYRLTGQGQAKRTFIAEVEDANAEDGLPRRVDENGISWLPVGNLEIAENNLGDYFTDMAELQPYLEEAKSIEGGFLCIVFVMSDARAGERAKGSGAAQVEYAKQYARERGMKALYLDCWVGGTLGLVNYYESLGFTPIGDYSFERPRSKSKSTWNGRVFRMSL